MFTATLYNSTGFTLFNIPDSEATLAASAVSTKNVPAMDILQLMYNPKIIIRAFEEDVINADYLKLTKDNDNSKVAFYVINGYTMTSGDTIELDVVMEPILTAGGVAKLVDSNTYIDGIITRRHKTILSSANDRIVTASCEEDPMFSPARPTEIEYIGRVINGNGHTTAGQGDLEYLDPYTIQESLLVVASVDIEAAKSFRYDIETSNGMETYVDAGLVTASAVDFRVPTTYEHNTVSTSPMDPLDPTYSASVAAYPGVLYRYNSHTSVDDNVLDFRKDLLKLCANNMQNIITSAYFVPSLWLTSPQGSVTGKTISNRIFLRQVNHFPRSLRSESNLAPNHVFVPIEDDDSDYAELYLGKYNQLIFIATASGNKKEVNIENLSLADLGSGEGDLWTLAEGFADPRPEGGVNFAIAEKKNGIAVVPQTPLVPGLYGKDHIVSRSNILEGGKWYHMPINIIGSEGATYNSNALARLREARDAGADIQSVFGLTSERGTYNPLKATVDLLNNQAEKEHLQAYQTEHYEALNGNKGLNGIDYGQAIYNGSDRVKALVDRELERSVEYAQYNQAHAPHPIVVAQPASSFDIQEHSLILFKRRLSDYDVERFRQLINRFGVRETVQFTKDALNSRQKFNYIECNGVTVNIPGVSKEMNRRVSDALNGGVRIWHVKPNTSYYAHPHSNPNAS